MEVVQPQDISGGTPALPYTSVQFNDGGVFGGIANITITKANQALNMGMDGEATLNMWGAASLITTPWQMVATVSGSLDTNPILYIITPTQTGFPLNIAMEFISDKTGGRNQMYYTPSGFFTGIGNQYIYWNRFNQGTGSGMDADTVDGIHATSFVPYTGATGNVGLGAYNLDANIVNINDLMIAGEYFVNGVFPVTMHAGFAITSGDTNKTAFALYDSGGTKPLLQIVENASRSAYSTSLWLLNTVAGGQGGIYWGSSVGSATASIYLGSGIMYLYNAGETRYTSNTLTSFFTYADTFSSDGGVTFNLGNLNSSAKTSGLLMSVMNAGVHKFEVDYAGVVNAIQYKLSALNTAPASAIDTGVLGEIRIVDGFIYTCVATNSWKRVATATW